MAGAYFVPGQEAATYDTSVFGGGSSYNPLSAYYGYGYNTYINSVAGTSPFFASFLASTGYSGGSVSLGGYDITGNFASTALAFASGTDLAFPSEPWIFDPGYALPGSVFSTPTFRAPDTTDVYFDLMSRGIFSPAVARGIVGSIVNESGGNPWISEIQDPDPTSWTGKGGRPGYGVYQFTDTKYLQLLSLYEDYLQDTNLVDNISSQTSFMLEMINPTLLSYLMRPGISQFDAMWAFSLGFEAGRANFTGPLPSGVMGENIMRDINRGYGWAPDPGRINLGPMDDAFMP